jgi:hypothetical protein
LPVNQTTTGNHRDKSCLRPDVWIVSLRVPPNIDENLLDGILRVRVIRAEPPSDGPDQTAIVGDTLVDGRNVTCGHAL